MHVIINKVKMDEQGRIILTGLFRTMPKEVSLVINPDEQAILVEDATRAPRDYGMLCPIDSKNRVTIPSWIREEIGDKSRELFLIIDDGKRLISPKTSNILPS